MKNAWVLRLAALLLAGFLLVSCAQTGPVESASSSQTPAPQAQAVRTLDTWVVYWDAEAAAPELEILQSSLRSLSFFEAYFNAAHQVVAPEGFKQACERYIGWQADTFLTVVNDVVYEDRDNLLKDTDLLYDLLADKASMTRHVEALVALGEEWGVDGIEIDYEGMRDDEELWRNFEGFVAALQPALAEKGLKLRVILEPSAPFETLSLPEGVPALVMCYNLHNRVGDEGPKADRAFLKELINRAEGLDTDLTFALATGGFDWTPDTVTGVNETQCAALAEEYSATATRDSDSAALTFQYRDGDNRQHTVWYADGETLAAWMGWVAEEGDYPIAIWRTGGNRTDSVRGWLQ